MHRVSLLIFICWIYASSLRGKLSCANFLLFLRENEENTKKKVRKISSENILKSIQFHRHNFSFLIHVVQVLRFNLQSVLSMSVDTKQWKLVCRSCWSELGETCSTIWKHAAIVDLLIIPTELDRLLNLLKKVRLMK